METGREILNRYGEFLVAAGKHFESEDLKYIQRAVVIADEKLAGLLRYDNTPLIEHSLNTARIVFEEVGLGSNSTTSTILHDVVRLGMMTPGDVGGVFGKECVGILKGLCDISDVDTKESAEQAGNFRELIVSYSTDPRVILIKLADRLEVMRAIKMFPADKQRKKSWESLNLYAQIAHKLGLYSIKSELEDISLSVLEPKAYNEIHTKLEEGAKERDLFIGKFLAPIIDKLDQSGIQYTIKSRTKSIYSIWSKMRRAHIPFEEVFDIFALRITFDSPKEQEKTICWNIYSVVTDFYTPNPERMRDWISIPKSNGYESLHATVVTKEGQWVEIQIRSERMDAVAERGIAAHWRYKGVNQGGMGTEEWLGKLREMMESEESHELATKFDSKLSSGEIFVFTPNGDLRKLPEGATLLDFAFDIHTNLGSTCTGGRVNQRNVPIREVLKNGDIVEVSTSKNQKPKPDWLNIAITNKARNKIRSFIREEKAKAATLGREELERKLKNWKLSITIDDAVNVLCKFYKVKTGVEIYSQIAAQVIDISAVKDVITRHLAGGLHELKGRMPSQTVKTTETKSGDALIIDDSISQLDYKLGKCCNPIFGDEVFGFVTINAGITIHRNDCPNAMRLREHYPYRVLEARWRDTSDKGAFRATIKIVAEDITGIVNNIADVITRDLKLNIRSMSLATNNGTVSGLINIEVAGTNAVDLVIHSIMRVKGVQRAYRVNN